MGFKQIAKNAVTMSELHNGRTKLETAELVGQELKVTDFDIVVMQTGEEFAVFTFDGKPDRYYNAGLVLTKAVKEIADAYGGLDKAREAYKSAPAEDKLCFKLSLGKTKDGQRTLTNVEFI